MALSSSSACACAASRQSLTPLGPQSCLLPAGIAMLIPASAARSRRVEVRRSGPSTRPGMQEAFGHWTGRRVPRSSWVSGLAPPGEPSPRGLCRLLHGAETTEPPLTREPKPSRSDGAPTSRDVDLCSQFWPSVCLNAFFQRGGAGVHARAVHASCTVRVRCRLQWAPDGL